MFDVCLTPLTELFNLKAILKLFLVLVGAIATTLTFGALQVDEIILGHNVCLRARAYLFFRNMSMVEVLWIQPMVKHVRGVPMLKAEGAIRLPRF
jgi:hypothetical protein